MKAKLHSLIAAARAKEEEALVPHVNDAPPPVPGQWTAKDQLAHLTAWRVFAADELEANGRGETMPDATIEEEVFNARAHAANRDRPASQVVAAARDSWDRLGMAVDEASDEVLLKPRQRRANQPQWQTVPNNTYYHVSEHLGYWYTDLGDDAEAEKAALWGYDLYTTVFPEDRSRGAAEYNLGCLYAKRGRPEKALHHLKRGFELRPDLKEWARSDTDLDGIRAEVTELLA